ncbi:MAG: hypothetical protein U0792_17605 [Gemmataceae bacterium]
MSEFVLTSRGQRWPSEEGLVLDPAGRSPVAVVRAEPWPQVQERLWPDGARGRPWLWRLLGVGRDPEPSRTAVRRLADGYPLASLHRRVGMFHSTVGVFDGDDQRVGYCRWAFKGSGPGDEFAVLRADHSLVGEVRQAGEAEYRVSGPSGGARAVVSVSATGCCVSLPGAGDGPDGVLLVAAVVVLFQQVVARTPNRSPGQPT